MLGKSSYIIPLYYKFKIALNVKRLTFTYFSYITAYPVTAIIRTKNVIIRLTVTWAFQINKLTIRCKYLLFLNNEVMTRVYWKTTDKLNVFVIILILMNLRTHIICLHTPGHWWKLKLM